MSETKTYQVILTEEEIMKIEEALYDRASVLYAIADQLLYKNNKEQSRTMDKRASHLEKLATKIAFPLDEAYIKGYNGKKEPNSVA